MDMDMALLKTGRIYPEFLSVGLYPLQRYGGALLHHIA